MGRSPRLSSVAASPLPGLPALPDFARRSKLRKLRGASRRYWRHGLGGTGFVLPIMHGSALQIRLLPLRESFYGGGCNLSRSLFDVLQ